MCRGLAAARRCLPVLFAAAAVLLGLGGTGYAEIALTDISGHKIVLPRPANRILITDGRFLMALALIDPDPVGRLVAWPHDIDHIGPETFDSFRRKFPAIDRLLRVAGSAQTQSVEQIIGAAPDLAVFPLAAHLSSEERDKIEAAGIPVLTIDFFVHPLANLAPSLRLLGQASGRQDQAERFIAFRQSRMEAIAGKLSAVADKPRPGVFLEPHAGLVEECCTSPGNGNIGDYIDFAGGENIGRAVIPSAAGKLSLEYVINRHPQVYIATGGPYMEKRGGVVLGPGYSAERAKASLAGVITRSGFDSLPAIRTGRVWGLSHQLLNSPLDILALEVLAKAIHPELFSDIDVAATRQTIVDKFLPVPLDGTYWTSLQTP